MARQYEDDRQSAYAIELWKYFTCRGRLSQDALDLVPIPSSNAGPKRASDGQRGLWRVRRIHGGRLKVDLSAMAGSSTGAVVW